MTVVKLKGRQDHYSVEDVNRLRTWRRMGRSYAWIAGQLQRTPMAVRQKLYNLGYRENRFGAWKQKRWSKDEEDYLLRRKREGATNADIGVELKRTGRSVYFKWRRMLENPNSIPKAKIWTRKENVRMCQLKREGLNWREISEALQRSYHSVKSHAQRKGWQKSLEEIRWSGWELLQMQRMMTAGKSVREMSRELGRSLESVQRRRTLIRQQKARLKVRLS